LTFLQNLLEGVSSGAGMFRCTAVHTHRVIVTMQVHRISVVPLVGADGIQPVTTTSLNCWVLFSELLTTVNGSLFVVMFASQSKAASSALQAISAVLSRLGASKKRERRSKDRALVVARGVNS
jgi:hypothetical protein